MGMGERQIQNAQENRKLILSVLSDGKWHRHHEILEKTKLSPTTLSKHLKMLANGLVEKKLDLESGKYPYPVYYRIKQEAFSLIENEWVNILRGIIKKDADFFIKEERKPIYYLHFLNEMLSLQVIANLKSYFELGEVEEVFNQGLEYFVISLYRDSLQTLKVKLKELADQGENINHILTESENALLQHYNRLFKEIGKQEMKPSLKQVLRSLLKTKRKEGVEV